MCMAVGNVSLDDWLRFTSSLGWIGFCDPRRPPRSSMARLAITSLAFMLVWVPLPVCQTDRGKWASRRPSMTSSAAVTMARALSSGRRPSSRFTSAQAFFSTPRARITGRGNRSPPISKCSSDRWVCAPQYRSAATSMLPIVSRSVRVVAAMIVSSRGALERVCPLA